MSSHSLPPFSGCLLPAYPRTPNPRVSFPHICSPHEGSARTSPAAAWQTRTGHSTPPGFTAHLEQTCCIPLKSREQKISNLLRPLYAPQTGITTNGVSRGHKSLGTAATYHTKPPQQCGSSCSDHPDLTRIGFSIQKACSFGQQQSQDPCSTHRLKNSPTPRGHRRVWAEGTLFKLTQSHARWVRASGPAEINPHIS